MCGREAFQPCQVDQMRKRESSKFTAKSEVGESNDFRVDPQATSQKQETQGEAEETEGITEKTNQKDTGDGDSSQGQRKRAHRVKKLRDFEDHLLCVRRLRG